MGTTVDRVTLLSWLKEEGESVARGEPICEIETDKAVSELESVAQGVLLKQMVEADTEVDQGTVVAYIGQEGESLPTDEPEQTEEPEEPAEEAAPAKKNDTPRVPPLLRNLARRQGVDLASVQGTGPGGRITRDDIMNAGADEEPPAEPKADTAAAGQLSSNQALVARRVARSQQEIPPIDLLVRVDMSAVIARRKQAQAEGRKIGFNAFFVQAAGELLAQYPHFRSRLDGEQVTVENATDVGLAADSGRDLYIPVVRNAGELSLQQVQERIQELGEKTRNGAFAAEDLENPTFTVSNLGMFPVESFAAVIPPGQAAILAVGACVQTPVIRQGQATAVPLAAVTLSVDHRLINGREAAEFITALKNKLEETQ
jgi:pyruvate dehydrogenase E2 component (dihydrolipoamide acetyltransferase)